MINMMFIFVFLIIISIYGLTNFMIAKCTFLWLKTMFSGIPAVPFYTIYSLIAVSIVFMALIPSKWIIHKFISIFTYYWMAIFLYLFMMILIALILVFILLKLHVIHASSFNQVVLIVGWIIFITLLLILILGRFNALNIKTKEYNITIQKETKLDDLKVVLISDLHLGYVNGTKHMNKIVNKINEVKPDIVLIAGDIFDGNFNSLDNPNKLKEQFNSIETKYGIYVSFGNHDAGSTYKEMVDFIKSTNMKLLQDEVEIVEDAFVIVGRRDSRPIGGADEARIVDYILDEKYRDFPVIVMDHQPSNVNEYSNDIDLIVGGHTHKGQVFPANIITKMIYDVDYGYYRKDNYMPQAIVTSGIGVWGPPLRVGTNNEVAIINIKFNSKK